MTRSRGPVAPGTTFIRRSPALILPHRGGHSATTEMPAQMQQGHFAIGLMGVAIPAVSGTWNPANKGPGVTLSNNNLTATGPTTGTNSLTFSTSLKSSGRLYFETTLLGTRCAVGVANGSETGYPGNSLNGIAYNQFGDVRKNNAILGSFAGTGNGDVVGVAVDFSSGTIWFLKNGTSLSGNPATLSGGFSAPSGALMPAANLFNSNDILQINTVTFAFAAPAGFTAWA